MLALTITDDKLKDFMNKLLKEETFDGFEVRSTEVSMHFGVTINGLLDKRLLPEDVPVPENSYVLWGEIRPFVFSFIKGKVKPKAIKIVFSLPPADVEKLHKNASAYFINVLFENDSVMITTASSEKTFSMDKSVIGCFNDYVTGFFESAQIAFEVAG